MLNLRLALRQLIRSPGFTILAIITLGLGIGANTGMFSILNSVLLKPLPYPQSEQLDRIDRATPQNPVGRVSPADFLDLQREMHALRRDRRLHARRHEPLGAGPARRDGPRASRDREFLLHAARPASARSRLPAARRHGWQRPRPHHQPTLLAEPLRRQNGRHWPHAPRRWRTARDRRRAAGLDSTTGGTSALTTSSGRSRSINRNPADRRTTNLRLIGRRSDKLSRSEAAGFIANFGARLAADFPEVNAGSTWRTIPLNETVMSKSGRAMVAMLIGLSAFVLLIGCSNLANLLLARTMARAREFALRAALGASRMQLLRPLIAESLLLALAGGAFSIVVAGWVTDWLSFKTAGENGERVMFVFDWRVFAWAFGAALITAVAFGLAPALFALRLNVNDTLKSAGRGMTGGRGHRRFRQALIVGQFALAMILLTGAALFVRGLNELNNSREGWRSEQRRHRHSRAPGRCLQRRREDRQLPSPHAGTAAGAARRCLRQHLFLHAFL